MDFKQIIKDKQTNNSCFDIDFDVSNSYYTTVFKGYITYKLSNNKLSKVSSTITNFVLEDKTDFVSFSDHVAEAIGRLLAKSNKAGKKTLLEDGYITDEITFNFIFDNQLKEFKGYLYIYPDGF